MATGTIVLPVLGMVPDETNPPGLVYASTRPYLTFDAATDELATIAFRLPADYASAPVLQISWGAASATSGNVIWACEVMAITPDTDTADAATDSYDTANTVTDGHLGTTAGRLMAASITLTNFDSAAAEDYVGLRISRDANNASDTMTGDAYVWAVSFEYTTT